jgi:hypothetical protein
MIVSRDLQRFGDSRPIDGRRVLVRVRETSHDC